MLQTDDNDEARAESLEKAIAGARVFVGACAFALLLFAGVVAGVSAAMKPALTGSTLVAVAGGIGGVGLLVGVIVGIVIGRRVQSKVRLGEQVSVERINAVVILSAALVEGPALMAVVAGLCSGACRTSSSHWSGAPC